MEFGVRSLECRVTECHTLFWVCLKGSVGELKDHPYTALDEHYISQADFDAACHLADDATNLLGGLMRYLRRTENLGSKFKRSPA